MASPTWFFDGTVKRIYEVPPSATFVMDGLYRVYNVGTMSSLLTADVKKDLWSRWIDWHATHDWNALAFAVSGGSLRPTGENAPADFTLLTSSGWKIVLANYEHETVFNGNLFPEGLDSLFDNTRLTADGVVPRLSGSANLLTYTTDGTGGGIPQEVIDNIQTILDILEGDVLPTATLFRIKHKITKAVLVEKEATVVDGLTQLIE